MPLAATARRLMPLVCALGLIVSTAPAVADTPALPNEQPRVETLPELSPHWFLVNDFNGPGTMDSKVYLFDADSGRMLGMLSTGAWRNVVETAPDFGTIYSPETYYSRGTRGERTDTVTFYDTRTLSVKGEAVIPPRRASGLPHRAYSGRSDDGRFVYVSNMTPANSVSVVNTETMAFASEVETAGCAMIYPTGTRSFAALCSDGTLQNVRIDDNGALAERSRSPRFFDPEANPITEKAIRLDNRWYFISFAGQVHPVDVSALAPVPGTPWSLLTKDELEQGYRVGGLGFAAVHEGRRELFVIVNQDGPDAHKNPGKEVRVYDIDETRLVRTIKLVADAGIIAVSRDASPRLYATNMGIPAIFVYDATTGAHLRTIEGPPITPTFVQVP